MFTTRPELAGTFGMVSSTHYLATAAAMAVLESGGNAFDAAAAAGFTLHVVEPHLNGPGGEVPASLATAQDPNPRVLCGQGVAPAGASVAHYRGLGLDLVPGTGPLAAAVTALVQRARLAGHESTATTVLTGREREVLSLVAEGLTNREIGRRLFISEKTASVHLSNLMAKLDVSSRTEAVTVAHRRGLLDVL